jgi:hypothetical protein
MPFGFPFGAMGQIKKCVKATDLSNQNQVSCFEYFNRKMFVLDLNKTKQTILSNSGYLILIKLSKYLSFNDILSNANILNDCQLKEKQL